MRDNFEVGEEVLFGEKIWSGHFEEQRRQDAAPCPQGIHRGVSAMAGDICVHIPSFGDLSSVSVAPGCRHLALVLSVYLALFSGLKPAKGGDPGLDTSRKMLSISMRLYRYVIMYEELLL